jgi:Domain of unknown function (DUF6538)
MRMLMGITKDRHGTFYARKKVPPRLQEAVARVLNNDKARQVWLKRSLGTKDRDQANRVSKRGFNFPAHRNLRVSEGVENLLG